MNRTLRLERETLTELTLDELADVAAGNERATVSACIGRVISLTLCGPSVCMSC